MSRVFLRLEKRINLSLGGRDNQLFYLIVIFENRFNAKFAKRLLPFHICESCKIFII